MWLALKIASWVVHALVVMISVGAVSPGNRGNTLTRALVVACEAVGLTLHDHVIVGRDSHFSFKGAGKL